MKKIRLYPGKKMTVNCRMTETYRSVTAVEVRVYQLYPKFAVLDNGKYKFCAYIDDLQARRVLFC